MTFQAGHIPSWREFCERDALSLVAAASRWLLLLLSPLLSATVIPQTPTFGALGQCLRTPGLTPTGTTAVRSHPDLRLLTSCSSPPGIGAQAPPLPGGFILSPSATLRVAGLAPRGKVEHPTV